MKKIDNPRQLAVLTLNTLEETEDFLREVLDFQLKKHQLSSLDQGLYTELVYGTTRMLYNLDYILTQFSSRPLKKIKPTILNNLRVAVYQILYLDRVPDSAAVNEGVKLARQFAHQGVANFTNGLLRTIVRKKSEIAYPSFENEPKEYLSYKYSFPPWMIELWLETWGKDETLELCRALNETPKMQVRTNTLRITTDKLKTYFKQQGILVTPGRYLPEILSVEPAHLVVADLQTSQGSYYIQDESSALVAHALQVKPGETIYDLCSAPGGKTTHVAQLMENKGHIKAFDLSPSRLKLVEENAKRLGITIITTQQGDATKDLHLAPVERVLVDAPCSGLGTMAHRPDIRWRKSYADLVELAKIQKKILSQAAGYVQRGGLLVYSTCTLTKLENNDIVTWFLEEHPEFEGDSLPDWFPQNKEEPSWYRTILPQRHGLDGFFIAVFRKLEH